MSRPVKFTFAKGLRSEPLEAHLGFLVVKHRAHGAGDSELAAFLSRDVTDEGLVIQDPPGGQPDAAEDKAVLLHVRRLEPLPGVF